MATCTDTERALIDTVMAAEHDVLDVSKERAAILAERMSPELYEKAAQAFTECQRSLDRRSVVIEELKAAGYSGRMTLGDIWNRLEKEAERRIAGGQ